jgi:ABC-type polysaccharide/polyol phosphate export permease
MYKQRNKEAYSSKNNRYYVFECVFGALVTKNKRLMWYIVIGVLLEFIFSHIISEKALFLKKKNNVIEHKNCVLISSIILSEIFLILRRILWDMTKNV